MNIFAVDECPTAAAQALPDKLVVKMPLETTQILSTASELLGVPGPYRKTHQHHPCVKWVMRDRANWLWTLDHGRALCDEYRYRYGKTHGCEEILEEISEECARPDKFSTNHEPFFLAMPDELRHDPNLSCNPVEAYREYLRTRKAYYARWTRRSAPTWWIKEAR